ncbi:Hypothetical predicted protein [Paramuricea clavata]|uniref:Uncharacterized protein n=1 Tax=Paramuricea clavata TaxID=317549 RepID=A0A7D9HK66_PARCT|nr:Hypothetical predicted protein [Paramuricea clavata]
MARITLVLISVVLMLVLVERTVSFTAVDASWGKRSEKVTGKDMCELARQICNRLRSEKHDVKQSIERQTRYSNLPEEDFS